MNQVRVHAKFSFIREEFIADRIDVPVNEKGDKAPMQLARLHNDLQELIQKELTKLTDSIKGIGHTVENKKMAANVIGVDFHTPKVQTELDIIIESPVVFP